MRFGGSLKEAACLFWKDKPTYAVCHECEVVYLDDWIGWNSVKCPNKCGNVLERGFPEEVVLDMLGMKVDRGSFSGCFQETGA